MPVNREHFIIVNIWTSKENKALPGINVGHASITTSNKRHISLWPGKRADKTRFFPKVEAFLENRPPSYKQDYEQDCVLEAYHEGHCREITEVTNLQEGEILYQFNTVNYLFERVDCIPKSCPENLIFLAVCPLPATFRVVFYSVNEEKVESEFDKLQKGVTGWRMLGSNLFTRGLSKTTETAHPLFTAV